jgi:hypothetical protein
MAGMMSIRTAGGIGATSFKSGRARTITVQNEEFIGAVTVANQPNFNVVSYPVNPGQSSTFPWLSLMAPQWEKYTFNMLEFYYKREVSEFNAAGQAGKVIFSADFDASDAPPSTKQQMEDSVPHADGMPCENLVLKLPKNQMHWNSLAKYVRPGGLPGSADIKTYDVANVHIATQGIPANNEIGELRVRYSCTFSVPVLDSTTAIPANNSVALFESSAGEALTSTVAKTMLLASATTNGLLAVNTAGSIVLPPGNYLADFDCAFANAGGNNCTVAQLVLLKNGTPIANTTQAFVGPALQTISQAGTTFVRSNGTDVFIMNCSATFGASTETGTGSLRFVAI